MLESTKKEFGDKSTPTAIMDSQSIENEPIASAPGPKIETAERSDSEVHGQVEGKNKDELKATSTVKNALYESGTILGCNN